MASNALHDSFTTYSQSLRARGTYAPNRATTISDAPTLQRRAPIPEDFRMVETIRAPETDLIDTAIVIKNIPFGYAEEDFVNKLFPQLGLVPPYAFNYHRAKADRSFHGLAFANFTAAHEAQAAVDTLNNYELDRRRLRVELKKRLPAEEEQRQRLARQSRRQLPQQVPFTQETTQPVESMPMSSDILDPQLRPRIVFREPPTPSPPTDLDMNDPQTLGFYTTMQLFRNNPEAAGAVLQFPSTLTPTQRRIVRSLAIKLNLDHTSHGVGSDRFITVSRPANATEPTEEAQVYRPFPTARASTEQLSITTPLRSPLSPTPHLRTVASMGNLRSQRSLRPDPSTMPPMPPVPFDMFPPYENPFNPDSFRNRLGHRSSQESAVSSGSRSIFNPTRQPHGPPQDQTRGFSTHPSREQFQIRPIGRPKTPSHGSVSQSSRGGSDIITDLQVQSSAPLNEF